jgi:uncharacterized protein involved in exopolysaccharide biosynthesis
MPQDAARANGNVLSGLAAQFGVPLGTSSSGQSAAFYAGLLRSRVLLMQAALSDYELRHDNVPLRGNLPTVLAIATSDSAHRMALARQWLQANLEVGTVQETGLVTLSVRSPYPELSFQIAARLLMLVDAFNQGRRRTQAASERIFVDGRVKDAAEKLSAVEQRLQEFLQKNREYRNSPQLIFEYDRLGRALTMQQSLYTALAQAEEQARVEEIRNTPVVTVVDPPELPMQPDARLLIIKTFLAVVVGALIGCIIALALDGLGRELRPSRDREDFDELRKATLHDLQRPFRAILRIAHPG